MGENDKGERVTLANPCHPGKSCATASAKAAKR